jgi:hypothetical protein
MVAAREGGKVGTRDAARRMSLTFQKTVVPAPGCCRPRGALAGWKSFLWTAAGSLPLGFWIEHQ